MFTLEILTINRPVVALPPNGLQGGGDNGENQVAPPGNDNFVVFQGNPADGPAQPQLDFSIFPPALQNMSQANP